MRPALVLALLTAVACSPRGKDHVGAAEGGAQGATSLTPAGFGPVRIGATVAELNATLGDSLKATYQGGSDCTYIVPKALPVGVRVMVVNDTVVRIEVDSNTVATAEGARIGDSEAQVRALYGNRAEVTPHKYTGPEGHYITVVSPSDSTRMTIFETDGKTVLLFRAGIVPAVQYVEGCA